MRYDFYTVPELELMEKALKCIEAISENKGMFGLEVENDDWGTVFKLAHAGRSPSCRDSHLSWEDDINKLYEGFAGEGLA